MASLANIWIILFVDFDQYASTACDNASNDVANVSRGGSVAVNSGTNHASIGYR